MGPKRSETKAADIASRKPVKTTLEGNYYHNRLETPEAVKRKGYTRYVSKKLADGTILTLAYKK
jgi:UDP-galactopyranose mutase